MGSGGPRGLQIPRSGASRVRGRFDSYAFPPLLALLCALGGWLPAPPPARAQADPPPAVTEPGAVAADSLRAPADTVRAARVVPPARWGDQPRFVMARSLLVPGWGQLHNGSPLKALGFAAGAGWLIATLVQDNRDVNRLFEQVNAAADAGDEEAFARYRTEYNARLDDLSTHSWTLGAVVIVGMLDAYVDANFRGFDVEFRHDPALPEGPGSVPEVRLLHRWNF